MSVIQVCCDLCGGDQFKILYPASIADFERAPEQYYSSSRTKAVYLPIVQCLKCGLTLTNPRDDAPTLAAIYANLQDPTYDREAKNRQRLACQRVDLLRQQVGLPERKSPPRLLDAGCATGFFAGAAQSAGWQVTGLEPSHWSVQQARQRYPQVNFVEGLVERAYFAPASFDLITLWDVLEHVASPTQTLRALTPWLAQGGLLVLNIPNIASLPARLMGRRWVLLLREHLWYFSPRTIQALLASQGYRVEAVRPNWVTFSLQNILRRLAQYLPGRGKAANQPTWAGNLLANISLSFPMGEMIVIARKK